MQNCTNCDDIGITLYSSGISTDLKIVETVMAQKIKDKESFYLDSNENKVIYDASGTTIDKNNDDTNPNTLTPMGSHVMFNNFEPEMQTHWAIAAVHVPETDASYAGVNWEYPVGNIKNHTPLTYIASVDDECATYYDANILFKYTDTMEGKSTSENSKIKINFDVCTNDLTARNYNAFKAVNSNLSRLGTDGSDNGITYADDTSFNSTEALLSNKMIKRNANTGELYTDLAYQANSKLAISVVNADNSNVIFGGLKIVQDDLYIDVSFNPDVSVMTMIDASDATNTDLPTQFTTAEFLALFSATDVSNIGPGYKMNVNGSVGGGYSLDFSGCTLDDNTISRNIYYMTKMNNFSDVCHNILITNGNLIRNDNSHNFMFEIEDGNERLGSTQYNENGEFNTYVLGREQRVQGDVSNNTEIPSMRISYNGETSLAGVIPTNSDRLTTYDVSYSIEVLVPATDSSSSFLMNDAISKSNSTVAVIANDSNYDDLFNKTTVTYTASDNVFTDLSKNLNLFQIKQNYDMDQESGAALYSVENGVNVKNNALISVTISNANLATLQASDIRVNLYPKSLTDITQWPATETDACWFLSDASDQALMSKKIIQNDLLYNDDVQRIANNKIPFTYSSIITAATKSTSTTGLNYKLTEKVTYTVVDTTDTTNTKNYERRYDLNDGFEVVLIDSSCQTVTLDPENLTLPNGLTAKIKFTKSTNYIKYKSTLGCYENLSARTNTFYSLVGEIFLVDSNGNRVPDGQLKRVANENGVTIETLIGSENVSFTYKGNKCFRLVSFTDITSDNISTLLENAYNDDVTNLTKSLGMKYNDLYGFFGFIEKKDKTSTWLTVGNVVTDVTDVDVVYDLESAFTVERMNVRLNVDITNNTALPVSSPVLQNNYYIELSNATGSSTFIVTGKQYTNSEASIFGGSWNPLSDNPNNFYVDTNVGSNISGLSASVSKNDLSSDDPSDQNTITLNVYRHNLLLFTFVSDINIAANFNIIYNPNPLLKVVETIVTYPLTTTTTSYISDVTESDSNDRKYVKFVDGVEIILTKDIDVGDKASFVLLSDQIMCKPYPDYTGNYSVKSYITPALGLDIGDDFCRHITLNQYRGVYSNTPIALIRSVTTFEIEIKKNNLVYTQNLGELWNSDVTATGSVDCLAVVDNLVNKNDINDVMGSLGIELLGLYSMFVTTTNMTQPIVVTHATYNVNITNPLDTSYDASYNVTANEVDIKLFQTLKIKASKVKIYANETYIIEYKLPDAKIYHYNNDVVNLNVSTISNDSWSLLDSYSDATLRADAGVTVKCNDKDTQIHIKRNNINVVEFTEYYSMVPPQFRIEAISVDDVSSVPYVATGINRKVSHVDINPSVNSYLPFTNYSGMNNLEVVQLDVDKYTDKRLDPKSAVTSFEILANTVYIKMSIGDIESDYPVVDESSSPPTNLDYLIYKGQVNLIESSKDVGVFEPTYSTETEIANFNFKQPMDYMISSDIAARLNDLNIIINGIHAFGVGEGRLYMRPGDSVAFNLYGCRIVRHVDASTNDVSLRHVFVKYETGYGFDFFNEDLVGNGDVGQVLKNIKFPVTKKYETYVEISKNNGVLTDTPYNLKDALKNVNLPYNWSWIEDTEFESRTLRINVASLSTYGLQDVQEWLSVNNTTQFKALLLETPDILTVRSLDGALAMKISYSGTIFTSIFSSYESSYSEGVVPFVNDETNAQNVTDEFFSYNITSLAGN